MKKHPQKPYHEEQACETQHKNKSIWAPEQKTNRQRQDGKPEKNHINHLLVTRNTLKKDKEKQWETALETEDTQKIKWW